MLESKIPKGYKQTELGVIPEDWACDKIKNILKLRKEKINPLTSFINYKCIDLENIATNTGRILGFSYLKDGKSLKNKFYKGDILFGKLRPYLRKYSFVQFNGVSSSEIWVLTCDNNFNNYFYFCVQTNSFIEAANLTTGTKMPRADWNLIRNNFLVFPQIIEEQKAIAQALSDTDKLIEATEKLIEKKKLIKKGAMQNLLTDKVRLPGFTGEWKDYEYNQIFNKISVKEYQINSNEYEEGGRYPVVDQGKTRIIAFSNDYKKLFNNNKGVIVFGDHTRIVKYIRFSFIIGADGTQLLESKQDHSTLFLYYMLCNKDIPNTGYNRHFKFIKEGSYSVPANVTEQTAIANILSDMDNEIEALEKKLNKYKQIKQGMMSELLTGRIRLPF